MTLTKTTPSAPKTSFTSLAAMQALRTLAVGSVLGATAIIAAWYGVNYLFGSGLHSYGSGAGGQLEVSLLVAANWVFMIAAGARYLFETRAPI